MYKNLTLFMCKSPKYKEKRKNTLPTYRYGVKMIDGKRERYFLNAAIIDKKSTILFLKRCVRVHARK